MNFVKVPCGDIIEVDMLGFIKGELLKYGIEYADAIPLSLCRITRQYKLDKCGFDPSAPLFAIIFAIPYYTDNENKNISSYAIARDYHLFCEELFNDIIPTLEKKFTHHKFFGFADNSPINERHAAALSGIGIIGDNGMLITEKYSSYVFLAEIITDLPLILDKKYELLRCEGCGKCQKACPTGKTGECLSAVTQKKGKLSQCESNMIISNGSAWGCDICQEVCPHTEKAKKNGTLCTNIDFFSTELIPTLSRSLILEMSDDEFKSRAYSWRGREAILRNLDLIDTE